MDKQELYNKLSDSVSKFREKFNLSEGSEEAQKAEEAKEEAKTVEMGEAQLSDGVTVVKWDGDLAPGVNLMVMTEDGDLPAPSGEHTLVDGTIVVVEGEEGTVIEVIPAGEAEGKPEAELSSEESKQVDQLSQLLDKMKSMNIKFEEHQKNIEDLSKRVEEFSSKLEAAAEVQEHSFKLIEKISEEPSEQPTQKKAHPLSKPKNTEGLNKFVTTLNKQ